MKTPEQKKKKRKIVNVRSVSLQNLKVLVDFMLITIIKRAKYEVYYVVIAMWA